MALGCMGTRAPAVCECSTTPWQRNRPTQDYVTTSFIACSIGYVRPFAYAPLRFAMPEPAHTRSVVTSYQTGSRSTLFPHPSTLPVSSQGDTDTALRDDSDSLAHTRARRRRPLRRRRDAASRAASHAPLPHTNRRRRSTRSVIEASCTLHVEAPRPPPVRPSTGRTRATPTPSPSTDA